jgi:hypothetical protein
MLPGKAWNLCGETDLAVPDGLLQPRESFMHDSAIGAIHSGVSFDSHMTEPSEKL